MFGVFIVACGLTHVMGIWTIWHPMFWLDGGIKAFTAVVSLATAVMLVPLIPKALTLRTSADLERVIAELEPMLANAGARSRKANGSIGRSARRYRNSSGRPIRPERTITVTFAGPSIRRFPPAVSRVTAGCRRCIRMM